MRNTGILRPQALRGPHFVPRLPHPSWNTSERGPGQGVRTAEDFWARLGL